MNTLYDLSSVRRTLRHMLNQGYLTVETLDTPSPAWHQNAKQFALDHPRCAQPVHRNLLREDATPTVQRSDARDYTPQPGSTPAEAPPLPITLDQPLDPDSLDW